MFSWFLFDGVMYLHSKAFNNISIIRACCFSLPAAWIFIGHTACPVTGFIVFSSFKRVHNGQSCFGSVITGDHPFPG